MAVLEAAEPDETVDIADEAAQHPIFVSKVREDESNANEDNLQESLQSTSM